MPAPCIHCGKLPKMPPSHRCARCLESRLPMDQQIVLARRRRQQAEDNRCNFARVAKEMWPEGERWCSGCYNFRRFDIPGRRLEVMPGHSQCRVCETISRGERNFGVTAEIDEALGTVCNVCGNSQRMRALAKDHDHVTGKLRGKLCYWCNHQIIGPAEARGNPLEYFRKVVAYLENPPAQRLTQEPPSVV